MRYLIILCLLTISQLTFAQCDREQDSLVLVDLYNSANGMDWDTTWILSQPMDSWYGVFLNEEGCVECIDLDGHANCELDFLFSPTQFILNIIGDLPPSLQNLNAAEKILFNRAGINSGFPDWVTNMPNLKQLALRQCNITGTIPQEIGNLDSLTLLHLGANNLMGEIPETIGDMSSLEELFLFANNLSGPIPPSLGNLDNLDRLLLSFNFLSEEIPTELAMLSQLRQLVLERNNLTGTIPEEFEALDNLIALSAGDNMLSGNIPSFLPMMDSIQLVELDNNNFSGCLPDEILNSCEDINYNFDNNPMLAFSGDMDLACESDPSEPVPCDDGYMGTSNDTIQDDCSCRGELDPLECLCDFAGMYSATTTASNSLLAGWCTDSIYNGTIEIENFGENSYLIFTTSPNGLINEDISFGSFYNCYNFEDESSLPSGGFNGALQLVADCDTMYIEGEDQWGELYFVDSYSFLDNQLTISIHNSYGEAWTSVLTKQTGEGFPANNICYLDEDGDGFTTEFDCNDIDPNINPNATDILDNGIDEDCDGADLSNVLEINNIKISLYPNPTSEYLNIDYYNLDDLEIQLLNANGKFIQKITSTQTNIHSFEEGLYFAIIKSKITGFTVTAKIVKQ